MKGPEVGKKERIWHSKWVSNWIWAWIAIVLGPFTAAETETVQVKVKVKLTLSQAQRTPSLNYGISG